MAEPILPFGFRMPPLPNPGGDPLDVGSILRRQRASEAGFNPDATQSELFGNFASQALPTIAGAVLPVVGRAAPRAAAGAYALLAGPTGAGSQDSSTVKQLQMRLQEAGYYRGKIDGQMGPETQEANRRYQADQADSAQREIEREKARAAGEAAAAQKAETERQRLADEQRARERAEGEERLRTMEGDIPPWRKALRDYGPVLGYAAGGALGIWGRGRIKAGAEARSADTAQRAEALMRNPSSNFADRTSRVNQFWDEGGAGMNVPFTMAPNMPRGVMSNPNAPPAASLYRPPGRVTTSDAGVLGGAGLETAVSGGAAHFARERLAEAEERVRQDPSEVNIRALQSIKDQVAFFDFMTRAGIGAFAGYGAGLAKSAPRYSRPNTAPAEAMRLKLDQQVAKTRHHSQRQPRDRLNRFTGPPANDE